MGKSAHGQRATTREINARKGNRREKIDTAMTRESILLEVT